MKAYMAKGESMQAGETGKTDFMITSRLRGPGNATPANVYIWAF